MTRPSMVDAQYGIAKILRPFEKFESVYQDKLVGIHILFSENGRITDPQAGKPGYDSGLVPGVSVPLGSRVLLWLPIVIARYDDTTQAPYEWILVWRLRNLYDFRKERIPYHFPRQAEGVPVFGSPRTVIPAGVQSIVYSGEEPTGTGALQDSYQSAYSEYIKGRVPYGPSSILPDGSISTVSQGILPETIGTYKKANFWIHETQAIGDELLLFLTRPSDKEAFWNFYTTDAELSQRFGSENPSQAKVDGVYMMVGTSP